MAQLYDECVRGAWPTVKDAQARAAACSAALQTRRLKPSEIALARLTRGIARTALGDKVLAAEDYAEALKHYDGAVDPRNPDSLNLYRRATSLHAVGETDRALADYGDAIRVDPNNSLAYLGRGVLLAARKRAYNRAIEDFDKVLVLQPDNVDALISHGNAYSQIGDNGRALADLDRAIHLAPDNAQAYVIRGLANNRRGQKQLAMQDYEAALKIAPRYPQALANRAALLSEEGRYDQAIADLDESLKADSDNPVAYYNRGYAHFAKHEYDKALADYDAAIKLEPGMGRAYNNRCLIRAITGKDLVAGLQDCDTAHRGEGVQRCSRRRSQPPPGALRARHRAQHDRRDAGGRRRQGRGPDARPGGRRAICALRAEVAFGDIASIARRPVHHLLERLAVEEALQVLDEQARHEAVALRVRTADMRQHDDARSLPKRMLRRQRLLAEHVEQGTGDLLLLRGSHEIRVVDDLAAAEV